MKKLSTKKLSFQLSIIIIVSFIFIFSYFIISSYHTNINNAQLSVLNKLNAITNTLNSSILAQEHQYLFNKYQKDEIINSSKDSIYFKLHNLLRKTQLQNNIPTDIYTLVLENDSTLLFGVTSGISPYFKHHYSSAPNLIYKKYNEGAMLDSYTDNHGTWLSAFSPIKDNSGKTIAIVQADLKFDEFIMEARGKLYGNILFSFLLFFTLTSLVLYYVKKLALIDEEKSNELKTAFKEIKDKNKSISDSITYAQRIQKALISTSSELKKDINQSFILYQPKDVVSGDFPWYFKKDNYIYLAAVDCTVY